MDVLALLHQSVPTFFKSHALFCCDGCQVKEDRIRELRAAMSATMEGASSGQELLKAQLAAADTQREQVRRELKGIGAEIAEEHLLQYAVERQCYWGGKQWLNI